MKSISRRLVHGCLLVAVYVLLYAFWYSSGQVVGYALLVLFVFGSLVATPKLHKDIAFFYLAFFVLFSSASTLIGGNVSSGFFAIIYFLFVVFSAFLTKELILRNEILSYFFMAVSTAALIVFLRSVFFSVNQGYRYSGITGQENSFGFVASTFAILTLFSSYYFYYLYDKKYKYSATIYSLLALALSSLLVWLSGARGPLITVFLCAIYFSVISAKNKFKIALTLVVCLVLLVPFFKDAILMSVSFNRIMAVPSALGFDVNYNYKVEIGGASDDVRMLLAIEVIELVKERPFLGYGPLNFGNYTDTPFLYTHSNYLELLFSYGVLGTLFYILFIMSRLRLSSFLDYFKRPDFNSRVTFTLFLFFIFSGFSYPTYSHFGMYLIYTSFFLFSVRSKSRTKNVLI